MGTRLMGAFGKRLAAIKSKRRKAAIGAGGAALGFGAYYGHKRSKQKAFRRGAAAGIQLGVVAGLASASLKARERKKSKTITSRKRKARS